jgi:glycosyltransferase involved in cell wall biosynthesis
VLFGAVGGSQDPRKGWDLLAAALPQLLGRFPGLEAVVCGQAEPADPPLLGLPVRYVGRLHDDQSLAMLYSAADVVVVPSRLDNLPQMATEAQSGGVPVVAFDCGGLPDVVQHQQTGYLARPYDSADLAHGMAWVLESAERQAQLGQAARQRAVQLWSPAVVARQHRDLYEAVFAR